MESNIIPNSPEKPINHTYSETTTKPNERDSPNQDVHIQNNYNNNYYTKDIEPTRIGEHAKRHRRKKDEITDRQFQCPDCDKCYLSGPALTTHRKTKHGYDLNGEKKIRGRPKKDETMVNPTIIAQNKYISFFRSETRKPPSLDQTLNEKTITLNIIKNNLNDIFRQCQKDLFYKYDNVEKYPLYKLILENWEKSEPNIEQECYFEDNQKENNNDGFLKKIKNPCIDGLFYLYLREFSKKTNKDYFWFMIKFVVLFRECINLKKKDSIRKEVITEKKKDYSQLYNAEGIPEMCNDFYIEFMEPHDFFGLNQSELIELIQHFCYWLYCHEYTQSHLTLLQN